MTNQPPAFDDFFRDTHVQLRAALVVATGDRDLAFDAADEAFARAFVDWARVGCMAEPRAWVYRVGINVARRRVRRRNLEATLFRKIRPRTDLPAPAGELWHLVAGLPQRQQTAIVLRYLGDLTEEQIGVVMGVKRGTVSRTLGDAHARLAVALTVDDVKGDSNERV